MNAKVLIVDDSALTRRSLRQILETAGYEVVGGGQRPRRTGALLSRQARRGSARSRHAGHVRPGGAPEDSRARSPGAHRRRVGGYSDVVAGPGRRGRSHGVHQQALRPRRRFSARSMWRWPEHDSGPFNRTTGRADRADQHRLRPGGSGAVQVDRPSGAARCARDRDVSDRRDGRSSAAWCWTTTWRRSIRSSPGRWTAMRSWSSIATARRF